MIVGKAMDNAFTARMRQRLEIEQESLRAAITRLQEATRSDEPQSEHAGLGNHMADDASELFEQEKNLTLLRNTTKLLEQVEQALRRMANGTYGLCASCGQAIDRARLEARPHAVLCMTCKARQEKG